MAKIQPKHRKGTFNSVSKIAARLRIPVKLGDKKFLPKREGRSDAIRR